MIFSILILFSGAKKVKEMVKSGGRARGLVKLGLPNHSGSSRGPSIKDVRKNLPFFDPPPPSSGAVRNH